MAGNLGPQFHGTAADLHPGDRVLPRKAVDPSQRVKNNFPGLVTTGGRGTGEVAFSTTSENEAWKFADKAHETQWRAFQPKPRSSVLRVHPHPEQEKGAFHSEDGFGGIKGEMIAPHYDVAERIDIKPGRQGTFPSINWNQFGAPKKNFGGDVLNHPSDSDISDGHMGGQMHRDTLKQFWGLEELMDSHDEELASDRKQGRLW